MDELILKLPKKTIIDLLRQLSADELQDVFQEFKIRKPDGKVINDILSLNALSELCAIGGDALEDSEKLYD